MVEVFEQALEVLTAVGATIVNTNFTAAVEY